MPCVSAVPEQCEQLAISRNKQNSKDMDSAASFSQNQLLKLTDNLYTGIKKKKAMYIFFFSS
jgi:hypothetical protein